MKVLLIKDYGFGASETITVGAAYKQRYLDEGFYSPVEKMSFDNKEEEDKAWMERFN